jgi:hypothetical protein
MQFKSTLLAAALSASVAANFVIVTIPTPNFTNLNVRAYFPHTPQFPSNARTQFQSQINDIKSQVASRVSQLTASVPSSEIAAAASAQTALMKFVATAPSSLSIPAKVTEIGSFETFTSTPAWFTALPSDLKSYYEGTNSKVQSVVDQAVGVSAAPSSATSAPGSHSTGAASNERIVQYLGVGAAAGLAGVFAL